MHWAAAYVGTPFAEDGISGGLNCWSLCRKVLAERAGIDVPAYGEISADELAAIAGLMNSNAHDGETWRRIVPDRVGEFDLALMAGRVRSDGRSRSMPVHIGIMASPRLLLHVEAATATALVDRDHPSVLFRVLSFHRHRSLC